MSLPSPAPKLSQPSRPLTLRPALALAAFTFSVVSATAQFRPAITYPSGLGPFQVVTADVLSSCGGTPACHIGISSNPATAAGDRVVLDPHHIQLRARPLPGAPHPITYRVNVRCIDASGNRTDAFTPVPVIP